MGVKKKVVLLGDSAVGKTSLIRRFVFDLFEDSYVATIGSKVTRKDLRIPTPKQTADLTLMIWDILGREGDVGLHARTFAGVHGAVLVADMTRKDTLLGLERYWIPTLFKVVETVPMVFVCNKSDLAAERGCGPAEIGEMASRYEFGLRGALPPGLASAWTTSARTGENVDDAFRSLGHLLLWDHPPEDPVRELYQSLVAMGISRTKDTRSLIGALDAIIMDFCEEFADDRLTMVVLRQEIARAGIDVKRPARAAVLGLIDFLADLESGFKDEKTVRGNRERRLRWVSDARG